MYVHGMRYLHHEVHELDDISLLSPTLGLPTRFIDALFGVHITGISGWKTHEYDRDLITGFRFALVFTCTFTECVT